MPVGRERRACGRKTSQCQEERDEDALCSCRFQQSASEASLLNKYQQLVGRGGGLPPSQFQVTSQATDGRHERNPAPAYDPTQIEPKWQQIWRDEKTWHVSNKPDGRPSSYVLEMLPYPSGEPHMGH